MRAMHSFTAPGVTAELPLEPPLERAALSASCAFALPFATVPDSLAFDSGPINTARMAREGVLFSFAAAFIVAAVCYLFPAP
jgi:di/tricarboxylate transporter